MSSSETAQIKLGGKIYTYTPYRIPIKVWTTDPQIGSLQLVGEYTSQGNMLKALNKKNYWGGRKNRKSTRRNRKTRRGASRRRN